MANLIIKVARKILIQSEIMKLLMHKNITILDETKERTARVDTTISSLRKERFQIVTELKSRELWLMFILQELKILKGFEEKETSISTKLGKSQKDKREIISSIRFPLTIRIEKVRT